MSSSPEACLYPLFAKLEGRRVLVVGAGAVAERKIACLLDARARVHVVSPDATPRVQELATAGALDWSARAFEDKDAEGAYLIVAATSVAKVQAQVAAAALARHVFVVAVDDPANASAYSGAVIRRSPFTIAISSSGATPALTRLLREVIEHVLPEDSWVEHAKELRAKWIASGTPTGQRFADLVRELAARKK
ncbi:MAG TPA: bifunctional precorrin-2 dehydrogenase/sirohydrochlorin ferrochelatase [Polyangiaceae bacterium]|jgi:siroheme synthase-like protein|nr:bifunctional precorrin-2 dehydrogenase/sirohydrochlorin ferrochelatase [Polyangiaceae bacterium]